MTFPVVPSGTPGMSVVATTRSFMASCSPLRSLRAITRRRVAARLPTPPTASVERGLVREAENAFADDRTLHLTRTATDRECRTEQEAVVPGLRGRTERATRREHSAGTRQIPSDAHDVLAVLVREHLPDGGLGTGLLTTDASTHGAQSDEVEHLRLDVELREPLARRRILHTARFAHDIEQVVCRRSHPPERATGRQRDALVAERHLGKRPALVLVTHQVRGGDAHVGEEHLVENVRAGHLDDGTNLDSARLHWTDEVRDAFVLRRVGIGA